MIQGQRHCFHTVKNSYVSFNDSSSDDIGTASYYWDFGDGESSTLANPTHIYKQLGSYQVRLSVIDTKNTLDHTLQTIMVRSDTCHAAAWQPAQVYRHPDKAAYNNLVYRAQWWTKGKRPDLNSGNGKVWRYVEPCLSGNANKVGHLKHHISAFISFRMETIKF